MKIALAQFNPIVADLKNNARRTIEFVHEAVERGADLVVFPELSITGYSPLDLLDNDHFVDACEAAVSWVHDHLPDDIGVIIGAPVRNSSSEGKRLFNAAVLLEKGKEPIEVHKMLLPTYDVYDEYRHFEPAQVQSAIDFRGMKLGVHICEDMWNIEEFATYHTYDRDPVAELVAQDVDILINLSASPFSHARHEIRTQIVSRICERHNVPFVLSCLVGANTEIIFDGDSRVHDAQGRIVAQAPCWEEALVVWDTEHSEPVSVPPHEKISDLYQALVFGIREYVRKTGAFDKVLLGLSGGIDSAVTAALAVDALGPENVMGVTMPSVYSSSGSVDDSVTLADNLGIECHTLPIRDAVAAFENTLAPIFEGTEEGIAEENIQARSRGLILMALANKFGSMVLTTGNKSEMAMGYATLYGDMSGGLAVLADVLKMDVYALAEYINALHASNRIPRSTIEKAPSAELRPDQEDADSLPPYPVLDEILHLYIEKRLDVNAIAGDTGLEAGFIQNILDAVDRNEYKRKQAPPALRVSDKAFGIGRRMPIVARLTRSDIQKMMTDLQQEVLS